MSTNPTLKAPGQESATVRWIGAPELIASGLFDTSKQVLKAIAMSGLPAIRMTTRRVRIRSDELEAWLQGMRVQKKASKVPVKTSLTITEENEGTEATSPEPLQAEAILKPESLITWR
jgi:hypothetical protein